MIVASIDIGTNTVLLLVARVKENSLVEQLANEYRIPRIGKGLIPGGEISADKIEGLFDILRQYQAVIKDYNCEAVYVTGTNALRIAKNGGKIGERIIHEFGWNVKIVSGEEEARLSYIGATGGLGDSNFMVIDIGGGSTELTLGNGPELKFRKSYPVGVVSATEEFFRSDPPEKAAIRAFKEKLSVIFQKTDELNYAPGKAIALAGTPTTLACILNDLHSFNEDMVEGSILSKKDIEIMIDNLSVMSSAEILKRYKTVVKGREDLILSGALILSYIMELNGLDKVVVSTKGIRYGAIYQHLKRDNQQF